MGGVIGGVALLAIIGFGIFFIRRRYGGKGDAIPSGPPRDSYAYHSPAAAVISEMDTDSAAGNNRQSYAMTSSPNPYNPAVIQQHYDPPKTPASYLSPTSQAPHELYSDVPHQVQQPYQQVPTGTPDDQGYRPHQG